MHNERDQWIHECDTVEPRRSRGGGEKQMPYITRICVCANVYAQWQMCKTINIDKKPENTSTVVATKFDSERVLRIAASEKRLDDIS